MFKELKILLILIMLTTTSAYCAGSDGGSSGGSEAGDGKVSKFKEGHNLVLSGKRLEKKADKFKKKGNSKKL